MIPASSAYLRRPLDAETNAPRRFFYKPITLTALGIALAVLAYVAMTQDVLKEGEEKKRMYVISVSMPTRGAELRS